MFCAEKARNEGREVTSSSTLFFAERSGLDFCRHRREMNPAAAGGRGRGGGGGLDSYLRGLARCLAFSAARPRFGNTHTLVCLYFGNIINSSIIML